MPDLSAPRKRSGRFHSQTVTDGVARRNGKVLVDIIDPHSFHLADALSKLQGLTCYTETHSQVYRRIEAVAEVGEKLRVLDMTWTDVRQAVKNATNAEALYKSAFADDYVTYNRGYWHRNRHNAGILRLFHLSFITKKN